MNVLFFLFLSLSSYLFTFSHPYNGRESIVFESNFRNGEFDGFTHPEKCFVESTKISIGPYLNEKLCSANQIFVDSAKLSSGCKIFTN